VNCVDASFRMPARLTLRAVAMSLDSNCQGGVVGDANQWARACSCVRRANLASSTKFLAEPNKQHEACSTTSSMFCWRMVVER
jgi:hypothetical protein